MGNGGAESTTTAKSAEGELSFLCHFYRKTANVLVSPHTEKVHRTSIEKNKT
jgi:hypothetical protein